MKVKKYIDKRYGGSNTYICINGNDAIIIDAGVSADNFVKDLEGINVVAVFITHAHFDHIYYLESYLKRFNAELYICDKGYQKLYSAEKNMSRWFKEQMKGEREYQEVELGEKFDYNAIVDGDTIHLDNFLVKAIYTPGHSNDSFTFIVNNKTAFVGDLIFKNGVGRTDFYDGDSKALVQSVMKLRDYPEIRAIHSGHGESTVVGQ